MLKYKIPQIVTLTHKIPQIVTLTHKIPQIVTLTRYNANTCAFLSIK